MKEELKIFIGISKLRKAIGCSIRKILLKYELTELQFAVLEAIFSKGDLTVGEVQERVLTTGGTIPVIVKNLEKKNYIVTEKHKTDKRKVVLKLTTEGRELIEEIFPKVERVIVKSFDSFNKDEKTFMVETLKKFRKED